MLPVFFAIRFVLVEIYRSKNANRMQKVKTEKETAKVLIYAIGNTIYFLSSAVISDGLLVAKNEQEKTISEKVILNSNYGCLEIDSTIMTKTKTATVSIISNEINYEKKLNL
jgi:hypothetical protein